MAAEKAFDYQKVLGTHNISIRAADLLEDMRPQLYNGANHAETVRTINDILQGRTERTVSRSPTQPYHTYVKLPTGEDAS